MTDQTILPLTDYRANIIKFSRQHPDTMFLVRCTNYCDDDRYYLKNGKLASSNVFNTKYAFMYDNRSTKQLSKLGLYLCQAIQTTPQNIKRYNLQ